MMSPIEWLSNDAELLVARNASGNLFSPQRAFLVLDGTPHYDTATRALGKTESPDRPEDLVAIRAWLLQQPGVFAAPSDDAPIAPLAA